MKLSKIAILLFTYSGSALALNADNLIWQSITFGQSTDLNFGSTILPEKVGVNETLSEGKSVQAGKIVPKFTIESRGGKLANSHEGLTYYYTELPTSVNFELAADFYLEQLGPETGANPNRQEGAGIMVRDILGKARANPQPIGYEEFPAASNMVMNVLRSADLTPSGKVNINASYREGIYKPWGTAGNRIVRTDYVEAVPYIGQKIRLSLAKTDDGFLLTSEQNGEVQHQKINKNPALLGVQNSEKQYLGFFASRNAKIRVENVKLALNEGKMLSKQEFTPTKQPTVLQIHSPEKTVNDAYVFQAKANQNGTFSLLHQDKLLAESEIKAGEIFRHSLTLSDNSTELTLNFHSKNGDKVNERINVNKAKIADPMAIYVSPDANSSGTGSKENPIDLASALALVAPNGTIYLSEGEYPAVVIPTHYSGLADAPKILKGIPDRVKFIGEVKHQADYWIIEDIEVSGATFMVNGSHNIFRRIITHDAPDTGFWITSPENIGRALWASYNRVEDSISFNNMDKSQINADGFAAKMRVGDGNHFLRCISHHNIDDGWDLFNKVEDGPNGRVTIEDSISFMNGQTLNVKSKSASIGNGFKLGGEGIPVSHTVKNSLAFRNNMDGFTDNFNPARFELENNVAIDNRRFNFLFRQSPYDGEEQGVFKLNRSYRFLGEGRYPDVVHGSQLLDNHFLKNTMPTPINNDLLRKLDALSRLSPEKITLDKVRELQRLLFTE